MLGMYHFYLDLALVHRPGLQERFQYGLIGILELHILPDQSHLDFRMRMFQLAQERAPFGQIGTTAVRQFQNLQDLLVQAFLLHQQRHFVNAFGILAFDDAFRLHIAEKSHLGANPLAERMLGTADNHIGLQALLQHRLDRMLGRFGLQLAGSGQIRHVCKVYHHHVLTHFPSELAHGLHIRQGLDIANRPADFGDNHIELVAFGQQAHAALDFIGHMRNNLNSMPQVIAATFLFNDAQIDTSCRDIIGLRSGNIGETFVMTQVQIRLGPVLGHIAFAMLVRVQCPRVDIDVGIQFLNRGPVATGKQKTSQRC